MRDDIEVYLASETEAALAAKEAETQDLTDDLAAKLREVGELRERIEYLQRRLYALEDDCNPQDVAEVYGRLDREDKERAMRGEGE
jgi:hypothetical protein